MNSKKVTEIDKVKSSPLYTCIGSIIYYLCEIRVKTKLQNELSDTEDQDNKDHGQLLMSIRLQCPTITSDVVQVDSSIHKYPRTSWCLLVSWNEYLRRVHTNKNG